jgi:hypothetical protein
MAAKRYSFQYSPQVGGALEEAPEAVLNDFFTLLEGIGRFPFPGTSLLGVQHYKETDVPGGYTASFDDGLLLFQVMADYPIIKLIQITWL